MTLSTSSWSRTLLAACVTIGWAASVPAQSDDAKTGDPAQALKKRSRPVNREYNASMAIDFGMMGVGKTKQKQPKRIEGPDIPKSRDSFSLPDLNTAPAATGYFPPPVRPDPAADERKENWILPPQSRVEEDEPDTESSDPFEKLMRVYEEDDAQRRRMIDDLFSSDSRLRLGGATEDPAGEDEPDSRYSSFDDNLGGGADNFLYPDDPEVDERGPEERYGYTPVITDSAFDNRDSTLSEPSRTERLTEDQLDQLSPEELAELATQQMGTEEENALTLGGTEGMSGIQQFTRAQRLDQESGLRQTQAIISGNPLTAERAEESAGGATMAQAGALSGTTDSWRGSLTTLSGVLDSMRPGGQGTSMRSSMTPPGTTPLGSATSNLPAVSRIRDQFSVGGSTVGTTRYSPTRSYGLGNGNGMTARPTSLDLGSSISSGFAQPSQGQNALSSPGGTPVIQPSSRSLDLRNLDILMK